MSLEYILLGMLDEPASGYDLGREFERSARLYWFAELSQVYPTLRRMEARGWLTSSEAPSERGPKRRVYRRTPEGEAELHAWLRGPPQLHTVRLAYIAQLCFLGQLEDPSETVRFVDALKAELEARLARFEAIEDLHRLECGDVDDLTDAHFHEFAALRAGIHVARARLAWCDETLARLEERRHRRGVAEADHDPLETAGRT